MKPGNLIIVEMPFVDDLEVSRPERLALKFEGAETLGHIWTFACVSGLCCLKWVCEKYAQTRLFDSAHEPRGRCCHYGAFAANRLECVLKWVGS
jgi:hypothetical protein